MRTFVAEFFYSVWLMREFIIADNQDISKAGMMFLLSKQKEVSLLLEADNKAEQEYPKRNRIRENNERDCSREKS